MLSWIVIAGKVGALLFAFGYAATYLMPPATRDVFRQRAVWVMPGLYCLAMTVPLLWVFLLLLVPLLPIFARTRGEAVALFMVAWAGLPDLPLSLSAGGSTLLVLGNHEALALGLLVASFARRGAPAPAFGWRDLPMLLFIVIATIAQARGLNLTSTVRETLQVLLLFGLPYLALRRSIATAADARLMLLAICFAAAVQAALALFEMRSMWSVYNAVLDHLGIAADFSRALKVRAGMMRVHGSFPESTSFGWFLALALTVTVAARRSFTSATHWGVTLFVIALGLFASGARIGLVAAAIGLVAVDLVHRRYGAVFRSLAIAAAGYVALYGVAVTTGLFAGVVGLTADGSDTLEYRKALLRRGTEEFWHRPLTGAAIPDVMRSLEDLRQGEGIIDFVNSYVFYALTTGIFGLIAFFAVFVLGLGGGWTALASPANRRDSAAAQAVAAAFGVSAFSLVTAFTSGFSGAATVFYFALLAAAAAMPAVLRRRDVGAAPAARRASLVVQLDPQPQ